MVDGIIIGLFSLLLPFLLWVLRCYWSVLTTHNLPPGPFPFPVVGNLHLVSSNYHIWLMDMAKKYGDIMTIYFGSERTIIVSSPEMAHEMLVSQSSTFGGRPKNIPYGIALACNNGKDIVFHHDMTTQWKKQRKLFHSAVKAFGSGLLVLQDKVCNVVDDLLGQLGKYEGTVANISEDVNLCVANTVCSITFGSKYEKSDQEFESILKTFDLVEKSAAPGHLVDVLPFLRKFPIKQVRDLKKASEFKNRIIKEKFDEHVRRLQDDQARDFTEALLNQRERATDGNVDDGFDDEQIQLMLFDMFIAGQSTSAATILWGICLVARHPEIQDEIHAEMTQRLKADTPPTFNDRHDLPLLRATVTEIYRYSSIGSLLLPHRAVKDAYISNYLIPKDTTVMINAWAIHHDPRIWDEPHEFRPSRFIDKYGDYLPPTPKTFLPFGAGKRGCAGETLGKLVVFLTLSRMLYFYRFTIASDQNMEPDTRREISNLPRSFDVCIERKK